MKYLVIFSVLTSLLFSSCDSGLFSSCGSDKEAYLNNMNEFVKEISKKSENSAISDWSSYDKKLEKFTSECFEQHKATLNSADKINIAANTAAYLYCKHGMKLILELSKQQESIKNALSAVDPTVLLKTAAEIVRNPEEIKNIMDDLKKRYDK